MHSIAKKKAWAQHVFLKALRTQGRFHRGAVASCRQTAGATVPLVSLRKNTQCNHHRKKGPRRQDAKTSLSYAKTSEHILEATDGTSLGNQNLFTRAFLARCKDKPGRGAGRIGLDVGWWHHNRCFMKFTATIMWMIISDPKQLGSVRISTSDGP